MRKEEKEKDAMWGRIAKAVDVTMAAEDPGKVEDHQIEHIINAILGFCTLSKSQLQKQRRNKGAQTAFTEESQFHEVESPANTILPTKQETWANVAASKVPKNAQQVHAIKTLPGSSHRLEANSSIGRKLTI